MATTLQTIRGILMITVGISAIVWFLFELGYRVAKRKEEGGFLYVETPGWHKILFWPITLLIIGLGLWAFFDG